MAVANGKGKKEKGKRILGRDLFFLRKLRLRIRVTAIPAFILVTAVNPFVAKLRKSPWTAAFLDGVNAASIGLMAAVAWELGRGTLIDIWTIALAIASLAILLKFPKINSAWLVIAGGAIGWLLKFNQ